MELTESLETLFGRSVDLVVYSNVVNPYFRASVYETKEPIANYRPLRAAQEPDDRGAKWRTQRH